MNVEVTADVRERARVHAALADPIRLLIVDRLTASDETPSALRSLTHADWNLLAHHLGVLEQAGLVERRQSEGDRRRRYVRLNARAAGALAPAAVTFTRPLFVCTQNSARSQFAAALWRRRTGSKAASAGSAPAQRVHPLAVKVAREHGLDLRGVRPVGYGDVAEPPDVVISVCDRAAEAGTPFAARALHWSVPDPAGHDQAAFRAAFSDIAERVQRLTTPRAL